MIGSKSMDKRLLMQGGTKLRDLVNYRHILETEIEWLRLPAKQNKEDIRTKQNELSKVNQQIEDLKKPDVGKN